MFSIVMAVRDKPHTIQRTLQSVIAQDYHDWELILVGDPEDESMRISRRIADPRLRLLHQPNLRQGPARNAGLAASSHDWIAFLDADDVWLPNHLAELNVVRRQHPEAGLIGTHFVEADLSTPFRHPRQGASAIETIDYFGEVGGGRRSLCTSSAAISRTAWQQVGGFGDTHFGEDRMLWAAVALAFPVAVSRRTTVVYLRGTGGITDTGRDRWSRSPLERIGDLSPSVALVVDRLPDIESPALRRSIDSYIRRYCEMALRASVIRGDVAAVRRLRRIYWGRPPLLHRVLFAVALLPDRLAAALYAIGPMLRSVRRSRPLRSGGSGRAGRPEIHLTQSSPISS